MLVLLAPENAKSRVSENAQEAGAPWALIKDPMFKMLDELRKLNVFILEAQDQDTANKIQEVVSTENKCVNLGLITVLTRDKAHELLEASGKDLMGMMWTLAKGPVAKYLDYFYAHNIWLGLAGSDTDGELIRSKSQDKNLLFRIKQENKAP